MIEELTYEEKVTFYNLVGSEGDNNTRVIVDNELKEAMKRAKAKLIKSRKGLLSMKGLRK